MNKVNKVRPSTLCWVESDLACLLLKKGTKKARGFRRNASFGLLGERLF